MGVDYEFINNFVREAIVILIVKNNNNERLLLFCGGRG
jgi:hypothetical protein